MDGKNAVNSLKYIIIGDSSVGKSNLLSAFTKNIFTYEYQPTNGNNFCYRDINLNDKTYRINIFDMGGAENCKNIIKSYYPKTDCALIVYEIDKRESFENVTNWIKDFQENGPETAKMVLVGNKCDLEEKRVVSKLEGTDLSLKYGMQFFETSAKKGINVNEVFTQSCELITKKEKGNNIKKDKDKKCSFLRSILEKVGCKFFS